MNRELREPGRVEGSSITVLKMIGLSLLTGVITLLNLVYTTVSLWFAKPKDIRGKVVIVTGSGRGLGRDLALTLWKRGAILACVDINPTTNQETVDMIKSQGGRAEAFTVNIAKAEQVRELAQQVKERLGPVDILVNNAALIFAAPLEEWTDDDVRAQFDVNVLSLAYFLKTFVPDMKKRNDCQIVTISSVSAKIHTPYMAIYSATKAGVTAMMNAVRLECFLQGNKSNLAFSTVHPFFINTSADYMDLLELGLPVLETSSVVDAVINTILYRYDEVTVPSIFNHVCNLVAIFPNSTVMFFLSLMRPKFNVPDRKFWQDLPYGKILSNTVSHNSVKVD